MTEKKTEYKCISCGDDIDGASYWVRELSGWMDYECLEEFTREKIHILDKQKKRPR